MVFFTSVTLARSSRKRITITMHTAWPVLDFNDIFCHQVQPTALLTDGFGCVFEKGERSMIGADDNLSPQQVLAILL